MSRFTRTFLNDAAAYGNGKGEVIACIIFPAFLAFGWIGAFFSYCAAGRIRADGPWPSPSVLMVSLYALTIVSPCAAYLYLAQPDWSLLYVVPAERVPGIFLVPLVCASAACVLGGFYAGGRALRSPKAGGHYTAILAAVGGFILILCVGLRARLGAVGSYADYHAGIAPALGAVKLGGILIALAVGVAAAAA